jgi:hypothetical protein
MPNVSELAQRRVGILPRQSNNFSHMTVKKSATAIMLDETRTLHLASSSSEKSAPTLTTLADKIEELVLKVGYSNAQALSVIIQILTVGKVRVDFRDYSQRLALRSPSDIMSRTEAMEVFDSHLALLKSTDFSSEGFTQKIMFQPPVVRLPR